MARRQVSQFPKRPLLTPEELKIVEKMMAEHKPEDEIEFRICMSPMAFAREYPDSSQTYQEHRSTNINVSSELIARGYNPCVHMLF